MSKNGEFQIYSEIITYLNFLISESVGAKHESLRFVKLPT